MPILTIPIPDTKDSIMRPIMTSITRELFEAFDMNPETKIIYLDESGTYRQHGSAINETNDGTFTFGSNEQILVEVDEEFVKEDIMNQPTWQQEYPPIFRDDKLQILIKPVYRTCYLNINFKKRFTDRTQAIRWRDSMSYKVHEYQDMQHHLLTYHYVIPREILFVLEEIHRLRENIDGYGEEFITWLKANMSPRLTKLTNMSGGQTRLAIAEKQSRVYGMFDFDEAPEKGEKDGENSTWEISFSYKVHYSRMTHLVFIYPQVVHQQPLAYPYVYDDTERKDNIPLPKEQVFSQSGLLFEFLTPRIPGQTHVSLHGCSVPKDDEFYPQTTPKGTRRLVTLQLLFQEHESKQTDLELLDLLDVPEVYLDEEILVFLYGEYPYMNTPTRSVFQVQLYNQYYMLNHDHLTVTPCLKVKNTKPINLRNNYHLRFSVYYDWSQLDEHALERLRQHPNVLNKLLDHLGVPTERQAFYDREDMDKIIKATSGLRIDAIGQMRTVETLSIVSYRDEHNPLKKDPYPTPETSRYQATTG